MLADALALEIPSPADGAEDSISIYPAWRGTSVPRDERAPFITTSVKDTFSIRQGGWKYIEGIPADKRVKRGVYTQRALYNRKKDPTESRNRIALHPDSAARLQARLDHARSCSSTRSGGSAH